jgi:hypothetical protein
MPLILKPRPNKQINKSDIGDMVYVHEDDSKEINLNVKFINLKNNRNKAISIINTLFEFGFIVKGRRFYIKSGEIFNDSWTNDFDTIMDQARVLPKIYIVINNLAAEIKSVYRETKVIYNAWYGSQWKMTQTIGEGLHNAPAKKVEAFIARQPKGIQYSNMLDDLDACLTKLKGVLRALEMQHSSVVAAIYHTRRSNDVYTSGAGGIVNSLVDTNERDFSNIEPVLVSDDNNDNED